MEIKDEDFIGKIYPQNCGDNLLVLEKTEKKYQRSFYYKCKFLKYPYEILALIGEIKRGSINNPQIEVKEFVEKLWLQHCGDTLKIIKKTDKKYQTNFLWECEFVNYPCKILALKGRIVRGEIDNPNLPWKNKDILENLLKSFKNKPTLNYLANYLRIHTTTIGQSLQKFNLQSYVDLSPISSSYEEDIFNYIKKILKEENVIKSNWNILDGKEIDIYIPDKKLGIEFNGNYWHSELFKDKNYHQEKSLLAKKKNINLIHIWEWEWNNNNDLIKSLLKSKLGLNKSIGARKCIVKEISTQEYRFFCEENHLQGFCGAKIKLGLFYNNELIQVMSFGKPRFNDKFEWEIIRECSKRNFFILGGKEKLWKYFLINYNPKNCLSYCDFSKFNGDSYKKLGFELNNLNNVGFVWWKSGTNDVFFRNPWKHQEMKEKGYLKIYDCGQLVFTWFKQN